MPDDKPSTDFSRRGRTFGMVVFGLIVGGLTAIMSTQIILEVFWPKRPELTVSCEQALGDMWKALQRARQSAVGQETATDSVRAFRSGLLPAWTLQASVENQCGTDGGWGEATKELFALRYAEERFARLGGQDLHRLRSRVRRLLDEKQR
jgi:hypothetical protein